MNEYEVFVEEMTPCGGEKYAKKQFVEIEADSPEAYVKANARFPIMDIIKKTGGVTVIVTGDGIGNIIRYSFTE